MEDKSSTQYLQMYDLHVPPQNADMARIDTQIRSYIMLILSIIDNKSTGYIFDIGCGNGVLLEKLCTTSQFKNNECWDYIAIDYPKYEDEVDKIAKSYKVRRRVEFCELDTFQNEPQKMSKSDLKNIFIVSNVLHELNIEETSKLFVSIEAISNIGDTLLIQDFAVFDKAERGNACWDLEILVQLLTQIGYKCTENSEETKRGIRYFIVMCEKIESPDHNGERYYQLVYEHKKKHLEKWMNSDFEKVFGETYRELNVAKADYDLQMFALYKQICSVDPVNETMFSPSQNDSLSLLSLNHQLEDYIYVKDSQIDKEIHYQKLRDRGDNQNDLYDFLISDKSAVIIVGAPYIGKTILVYEVLQSRAHVRKNIYIDCSKTYSIWNILELYLNEIKCEFAYELVRDSTFISYASIRQSLLNYVVSIVAQSSIVVFDHFENLVSNTKDIKDSEIKSFIFDLISAKDAKVIITTRTNVELVGLHNINNILYGLMYIGRLPKGKFTSYILDDYIDRASLKLIEYPPQLLDSIEEIPYLATLAAKIINKEGVSLITNKEFLLELKQKLRKDLINRIITNDVKPVVNILSLIRGSIPYKSLCNIIQRELVDHAIAIGLIYYDDSELKEYTLVKILNILNDIDNFDSFEESYLSPTIITSNKSLHYSISSEYRMLFKITKNPIWLREAYYHTLTTGDSNDLSSFGVVYKSDLENVAYDWFKCHDYRNAIIAFTAAYKLGVRGYDFELKFAATLMRVKRIDEGIAKYERLLSQYPNKPGIKMSYIDSYLYIHQFDKALELLQKNNFRIHQYPWNANRYGKAFLGMHDYLNAISAFREEIRMDNKSETYMLIALCFHNVCNWIELKQYIDSALVLYPDHPGIRFRHACNLIRTKQTDNLLKAEKILSELFITYENRGNLVIALCKICRIMGIPQKAKDILSENYSKIAKEYRIPPQMDIYLAEKKWEDALADCSKLSVTSFLYILCTKSVTLNWCLNSDDMDRIQIAKQGLLIEIPDQHMDNIHVLVVQARLAYFASEMETFEDLKKTIGIMSNNTCNGLDNLDDNYFEYDFTR